MPKDIIVNDARRRIAGNVEIDPVTQCWNWKGNPRENGYCRTSYKRVNWYIHRLSYAAFIGPIPNGNDVCHRCDNRRCCNPAHLFTGTREDNMKDCVAKGRVSKGERHSALVSGDNSGVAKLTAENVRQLRKLAKDGASTGVLSAQFQCSQDNVRKILNNKTWRNI